MRTGIALMDAVMHVKFQLASNVAAFFSNKDYKGGLWILQLGLHHKAQGHGVLPVLSVAFYFWAELAALTNWTNRPRGSAVVKSHAEAFSRCHSPCTRDDTHKFRATNHKHWLKKIRPKESGSLRFGTFQV